MINLNDNATYIPRKKKVVVNKDGKKEEVKPTLMHSMPTKKTIVMNVGQLVSISRKGEGDKEWIPIEGVESMEMSTKKQ